VRPLRYSAGAEMDRWFEIVLSLLLVDNATVMMGEGLDHYYAVLFELSQTEGGLLSKLRLSMGCCSL
jgi:hypothetical protein